MNGKEFIKAWKEFVGRDQFLEPTETWEDAWNSKIRSWTHRVIGKPSGKSVSPLGKFLQGRPGTRNWRFQKEYMKIDLVLTQGENTPMPYLWKPEDAGEWEKRFKPIVPDILIEHEDACGISWEEMIKLTHFRSRLKVLITYTTEVCTDLDRSLSDGHIQRTRDQFAAMIRAAWQALSENGDTEYVLIIGQLEERGEGSLVNWHTSIYTAAGIERIDPTL